MITLNTEKGLVKLKEWEDVEGIPGFIKDLKLGNDKLKEVIGRYQFLEKKICGLSTCHTAHNKGYVVSTKRGFCTNIGKDCGKKYFGVDFDEQAKEFDARVEEQENRDTLYTFKNKLPQFLNKLNGMKDAEKGANWINKNVTIFSSVSKVPYTVIHKLDLAKKDGSGNVYRERKLTQAEIEVRYEMETGGSRPSGQNGNNDSLSADFSPRYEKELVTNLKGISVLEKENSLREIIVVDLQKNFDKFDSMVIDSLTRKELRFWSKYISDVDTKFQKIERIIKDGRRFFTKDNLEPLMEFVEGVREKRKFQKLLNTL